MRPRDIASVLIAALIVGLAVLVMWDDPFGKFDAKVLRVGIAQEPDTLNWVLSSHMAGYEIYTLLYVPLITSDDKWNDIPGMAKRLPTLENGLVTVIDGVPNEPPKRWPGQEDKPASGGAAASASPGGSPGTAASDGKNESYAAVLKEYEQTLALIDPDKDGKHQEIEVRWELKDGVCWADGKPITADDFIFAWEFAMSEAPALPIPSKDTQKRIREMRSEDGGKTVVIRYSQPFAYAAVADAYALPRHVVEPLLKKDGEAFDKNEWNRMPLGNGPFMVESWVPNQRVTLVRNPKWWGPATGVEKIVYHIVGQTESLAEYVKGGRLDATGNTGLDFDRGVLLQKDLDLKRASGFGVQFTPGLMWEHIDCNLDDPILKDVRVRKALMLAMDRDEIVKTLFDGRQPVSHSWLPPAHYGYLTDAPKVTRNLDAAGKLLDEAGWTLSGQGAESIRKNDKGDPLVLTLMTTAGNKMRADVMQMLQAQLAGAGIKLKLEVQQAQTFFGETTQKRKFQLAMYAWIFGPLSDGSSFWTSEAVPSEANGWQGQNYCGLLDDEITRLDRMVPLTVLQADRAKIFQEEQRRWLELLPAIPLYFRTDITVSHKDLQNWRPTGTLTPISWNCHEWIYKLTTPVAE